MPPPYPLKKADKDLLYSQMVAGIAANPGDYPSGLGAMFNTVIFAGRIVTKTTAVNDRMQKEAALRLAVDAENAAYESCDKESRRLIALASAQHANNQEKLLLIGWGPSSSPTKRPPGQPRSLLALRQDETAVTLGWKAPVGGSGGRVAFYRIERRVKTLDGQVIEEWGSWSSQSLRPEVRLSGLTRGVEYELRVVAVNTAGDSVASNTASAVL